MPKPDPLTKAELATLTTLLRRLAETLAKIGTDLEAMRLRVEKLEEVRK